MEYYHQDILEFCEFMREAVYDAVPMFTRGNCVHFAMLLERQFPGGQVYHNIDHATYEYNGEFYDITGDVVMPKNSKPIESYGVNQIRAFLKPKYKT